MVTKLGATLANPDASTVGKEDIIAANPDVIFVVYMPYAGDDPQSVLESQMAVIQDDEALQSLDAVKNGRVYPIMLSEMYASEPVPRTEWKHLLRDYIQMLQLINWIVEWIY